MGGSSASASPAPSKPQAGELQPPPEQTAPRRPPRVRPAHPMEERARAPGASVPTQSRASWAERPGQEDGSAQGRCRGRGHLSQQPWGRQPFHAAPSPAQSSGTGLEPTPAPSVARGSRGRGCRRPGRHEHSDTGLPEGSLQESCPGPLRGGHSLMFASPPPSPSLPCRGACTAAPCTSGPQVTAPPRACGCGPTAP